MRVFQVRRLYEQMYTDICAVSEYESYRREDGSTGFALKPVYEDVPCRLSFDNIKRAYQTDTVSHTMQTVRLFMSPDREMRPGCVVEVRRGDRVLTYKNSGIPAVYATHQELILEPMKTEA